MQIMLLSGHLYERDNNDLGNGDDDLGPVPDKIYLKDIPYGGKHFKVNFEEVVEVGYRLERVK